MAARRHSPAQIVVLLRRADELLDLGRPIAAATAELGISPATFHRWRSQYGGIKAGDARRLSELAAENRQLRATIANQTLDLVMLRELVRTLTAERGHPGELVQALGARFALSQRRACQVVGEPRSTVRRALTSVIEGPGTTPPPRQDDVDTNTTETVFVEYEAREGALG